MKSTGKNGLAGKNTNGGAETIMGDRGAKMALWGGSIKKRGKMEENAKTGKKITVLGKGMFGSALGKILEENGHKVTFYDPVLEVLLEDTLKGAEILVLAVPSAAIWELLPRLPKDLPLIIATKGLLGCEPFAEFTDYEVLSGPGFARDLRDQRETLLTATGQIVAELFGRPYLKFDFTSDKKGVLMCGALKNVYAILAGKLELEPGSKEYDQFLEEAAEEMREILKVNGCEGETVSLSCGVGDLALTCTMGSRNFKFGRKLAEDPTAQPEETVEGVSALKRIERGEIIVPAEAFRLKYLLNESKKWAGEEV